MVNLPQNKKVRALMHNYPDVHPKENHEYIAMSAIYFNDRRRHHHQPNNLRLGYVVTGLRHHNCWSTKATLTGLNPSEVRQASGKIVNVSITKGYGKPIQGFVTSKNRFLNRKEACKVAYLAGQIAEWVENDQLVSEELY
jgi:hypothetical protein